MSAGFRWTVSSQPRVLVLNKPMAFEPAPAHRKNRWAVDSLDYSAREVISIASGRMEVEATIKFEKNAQGLVDMLRDAADGNVVTYYPDLSNGTGYALWLVSESTELAPQAGNWSLGNYEVRTRWRDASASGTSIAPLFERLLFRLDAGHFPLGYSFTRSGSVGPYIDSDGVLKSAAENIARIDWSDGAPGLLIERTNTNLVSSDALTGWSTTGTPVVTGSVDGPAGGTGAYTVADDAGGSTEFVSRTISFTGDGLKVMTFVVRENTMPGAGTQRLLLRQTSGTAADVISLDISAWTDGEPTVAASAGALLGKRYIGNGYWALYGRGSVTAAETNVCRIVPADTAAQTGSIDVYRVNAYDSSVPPVSILDASEVLGADTIYLPYTAAPQAITGYIKLIDWGSIRIPSAGVISIGAANAVTAPRILIRVDNGGSGYYEILYDDGVNTAPVATLAAAPTFGQEVELRFVIPEPGGTITLGQSIEGAAETTATASMPGDPLPTAFAGERLYLGSLGSGDRGVMSILSAKIAAGSHSMPAMRAL